MVLIQLEHRPYFVAFINSGENFVTGEDDGSLKVWDKLGKTVLHTLDCSKGVDGPNEPNEPNDEDEDNVPRIWAITLSADEKLVACGGGDNVVRVWEMTTKKLQYEFKGHTEKIYSLAFSPDGKLLASGGEDSDVKVWDLKTGKLMYTFDDHYMGIQSVQFNRDSSLLVSYAFDQSIKLWDVKLGKLESDFDTEINFVQCAFLTTDGKKIICPSLDKKVVIHDIEKMKYKVFYMGSEIICVAQHENRLALGNIIWDIDNEKILHTFSGHTNTITCVAFSPDGKRLISGALDNTVRIWDL